MFDNFVTSFSPLSSRIWISISFYVAKFSLSFTWSSVLFDMLYIFLLQEHKSAKTVGEMKQYVQRIPFMQRAKSSLATRKEFKRMMLAFLFISFTSRDTPFLTKYYITYFEDHSYSVKSQRKRTKTSASDFVLLQWMAQLFPPFSCVVWISLATISLCKLEGLNCINCITERLVLRPGSIQKLPAKQSIIPPLRVRFHFVCLRINEIEAMFKNRA